MSDSDNQNKAELRRKPRVLAMVRVSTDSQAEDDRAGIPRQLEEVERIVEREDLDLIHTYRLEGVSGAEVLEDPQFREILAKVQAGDVQGVIVADFDRLFRLKRYEMLGILDYFSDAEALIYTSSRTIDLTREGDSMMAVLESLLSGRELRTMRKRMHGAQETMRRNGEYPLGANSLPTGITYYRKAKKWGTNSDIAKVQEAYRLIDEDGITNIAEVARRVGIKYRLMYKIVSHPVYKGLMVYDTKSAGKKVLSAKGNRYVKKIPRKPEDVIKAPVFPDNPPVPVARWERVQKLLHKTPRQGHSRKGRQSQGTYVRDILKGISFCGACKSRLRLRENANRREEVRGHYACSKNNYNKDLQQERKCGCGAANQSKYKVHKAVLSFCVEVLSKKELVCQIIEHAIQSRLQNQGIKNPEPKLAEIKKQRAKVQRGYEKGLYTEEEAQERLMALQQEESVLTKMSNSMNSKQQKLVVEALIKSVVKGVRAIKRVTDPAWQKAILNKVFSAIYLENNQVVGFTLKPNLIHEACIENCTQQGWGSSRRRA